MTLTGRTFHADCVFDSIWRGVQAVMSLKNGKICNEIVCCNLEVTCYSFYYGNILL